MNLSRTYVSASNISVLLQMPLGRPYPRGAAVVQLTLSALEQASVYTP